MRLLLAIILIALLSFVAEYFLPWWSLAVVCFSVAAFFRFNNGKAFLAGFLGIFLLWFVAAFIKDYANEHILSSRMAQLFHLPNSIIFLFIGALIGAIVGGLAGWSGAAVRNYFAQKR
ncbi:MAG TPA: hypothetical protein PL009_11400 [Flavipsychrobacter sp.]|nr:hypothetical protein [Flavipsychrobacter sp.]